MNMEVINDRRLFFFQKQQDRVCAPGRETELVIMGLKTFIFCIRRKYNKKKGTLFFFFFDGGYVCVVVLQETGYFSRLHRGLDNE